MRKFIKCCSVFICLFIVFIQYRSSLADTLITEGEINAVINWANQSRSGYDGLCGAFVYDAFQYGTGKTFWSSRAACAYGSGHPGCATSMLKDTKPLTYSSFSDIPRGALVFYGSGNDSLRCDGHVGIYDGNGKICDATSTGTQCQTIYPSISSSWCYDSNNNRVSGTNVYKGWTTWTGYRLYSESSTTPEIPPQVTCSGRSLGDATAWAEQGITGNDNIKGTINGYDYTNSAVTLSYLPFDAFCVPRIDTPTDFVGSGIINIINNVDAGSTSMSEDWNKAPRGAILVWYRYMAEYGKNVSFIGIARGDGTMVTAMTDYGVTDSRIWFFNNRQTQNQGYVYQGWGFFTGYDFNYGTVRTPTPTATATFTATPTPTKIPPTFTPTLTPTNISPIITPTSTPAPIDFIIENGVLVEYTGTDKNVVIPNGVISIGATAFAGRTNIASIIIPESVGSIGKNAIPVNSILYVYKGSYAAYYAENNGFSYIFLDEVPQVFDAQLPSGLISIESEAFAGCIFGTISIPDGVQFIGEKAFANCANLRKIVIPDSVTYIADNAFEGNSLIIFCSSGSEAERFASQHDIYCVTN